MLLVRGPMGILGPMLIVLMCLWLGRGERSPRYIKVILVVVLAVLVLVSTGYV